MQTVQQRRERDNRQINERLRTLIAAYKTLGGSFTGNLAVDPSHLRDLRRRAESAVDASSADVTSVTTNTLATAELSGSDRARRIRDAVEAALSDIILLGTEQQVELAARAASELASGRPVHTAELVISLRNFIRKVLDLEPVPTHVSIPKQGPARPAPARSGAKGEGGKQEGGTQGSGKGGGGDGGMGGGGSGMGLGGGVHSDDDDEGHH
jgi:hypothetical protein